MKSYIYITEFNGIPVGCVRFDSIGRNGCWECHIFIDPLKIGMGIGSKSYMCAENFFISDCGSVKLIVSKTLSSNWPSRKLFEKSGFVASHSNNDECIVYEKVVT